MDVREGYQQTEVWSIPADWVLTTLGEICAFENGDRGKNYPSPGSFSVTGIPFVNAGHVADGRIDCSKLDYITRETYDCLGGGKFREGDILFCLRGSLGKFGVVSSDFGEGAIASSLVIIRPKTGKSPSNYLHCYFSSKLCNQMIEKWSGGAAQPNLGAQDLAKFKIPLPPTLAEQQAIAEALSDADALIELLEQLIAKKRQIKQGAMQELLTGKRRLPGFEGEWDSLPLGDCCQITTGQKDVNAGNPEGEFPFFTCSRHHTFSDNYSFDTAAILVAGNGEVGNLHRYIGKFEAYQRTYVLHDFSLELPYIWYQLEAFLAPSLGLGKIGSSIPYIKRENLTTFALRFPLTREERGAIAEVLSNIDAEIELLTVKLSKARLLKQGMMQELLTGRIRLV